jgi:hypothetical protein
MITLLLHLNNTEPVKLDVEELPKTTDNFIIGKNPRERTEKEVLWLDEGVTTVMFPIWRISLIQVLPSAEDEVEFPLPFRNE